MELQTGKFSKIEENLTEGDFKKQWSHIEREGVLSILTKWIRDEFETKSNASEFFGFAWTTYGRFAEYGVNDPNFTIDGNHLQAFIIRNNDQLVAHCFDADENDLFYEVQ